MGKASVSAPSIQASSLEAVPSTLRIPLAARAFGDSLFPKLALNDRSAATVLEHIGDDGNQWIKDRPTIFGVLSRTRLFMSLANTFLAEHPDGTVINLGCGLSDYFQWLDNGSASLIDCDLPAVIELRRQLLPNHSARHRTLAIDLESSDWWTGLGLSGKESAGPVFVICEGVLMYFEPERAKGVLATFGEMASTGSRFTCDAMCWLAAGRSAWHPSVKKTNAQFFWGPRHQSDLTECHDRLQLDATHKVMEGYGLPYSIMGPIFQTTLGVPFYALYELSVNPQ